MFNTNNIQLCKKYRYSLMLVIASYMPKGWKKLVY